MVPTGFYKIDPQYILLISQLGGIYNDRKNRPVYCCIQDKKNPDIYWAIPTSDISHRSQKQLARINSYCSLPDRDIRSCYYHIGYTNRPAVYKISNALPVTEKYISGEYTSQGQHLVLKNKKQIAEIRRKPNRILSAENKHPDLFEQHISSMYDFLSKELKLPKA